MPKFDAVPAPRDDPADVLRRIEEDIIFGRLAPGARLVEDVLIARYVASRHYIRQALVALERVGLVQRVRNAGATVHRYAPDEVVELYAVREMLTRQAILMLPLPAPDALIFALSEIQETYRDQALRRQLGALHETNDLFHKTMLAACGNRFLVQTLQDFMRLTLPMRAANLADEAGLQQSIREHDIMLHMLAGSDAWALAQLNVDHMQRSKVDYIARIMTDRPSPL